MPTHGKSPMMFEFRVGSPVILRGRPGRIAGPTKDGRRVMIDLWEGFRVAVFPQEAKKAEVKRP